MMAALLTSGLMDRLPSVMGKLERDAILSKYTWFRTGGPADVLFRPENLEDLQSFLANCPKDVPLTFIGVGSNMIIRDGGIEGVVIKLGKAFSKIEIKDDVLVAKAGAMDVTVASEAQKAGLAGLEFLRGIPGTIGGTVKMNGGAYGNEVSQQLVSSTIINREGEVHTKPLSELGFSYRKSKLKEGELVVEAQFKCTRDEPEVIKSRMDEIMAVREDTQPLRTQTGGSTFKNPNEGSSGGRKAWQLIDEAGCRGLTLGGAQVSEKHCNFLINTGSATSQDIEGLGEKVRRIILDKTGVFLEWEIRRVGRKIERKI